MQVADHKRQIRELADNWPINGVSGFCVCSQRVQ